MTEAEFTELIDALKVDIRLFEEIIQEVEKRLQPTVFDDHLKYSLVKFMSDNPQLWKRNRFQENEFKN